MTKLPNIGKPATNALESIGYSTLEQISTLDKTTLSKFHGVGPKAITILEAALTEHHLSFQKQSTSDFSNINFAVICSLNCDNAPKKRMIRDFLIAVASQNQKLLAALLSDSFSLISPGKQTLEGKDEFIRTVIKKRREISTLDIQSLLTHGKEGSTHGLLTTKSGDKIFFSLIIRFKSNQKDALISEVTSFTIQ